MALLGGLLDKLKGLFQPIIGPLVGLFNLITKTRETIAGVTDSVTSTVDSIREIVDILKNFKLNVSAKSRVVNIPKAIEHFNEIVAAVKDIWAKLQEFKAMFKEAAGEADTSDLSEDVQGLDDLEAGVQKLGPKFAGAAEKALGVLTVVLMFLSNFQKQFDSITALVNDIKTILEDLDNLEALFLSQKNARKTVELSTGQTMKIRVGKLHGETGT